MRTPRAGSVRPSNQVLRLATRKVVPTARAAERTAGAGRDAPSVKLTGLASASEPLKFRVTLSPGLAPAGARSTRPSKILLA